MENRPRLLITPLQWFVGAVVLIVGASLAVALLFRAPRPDRVWDFSYPGAPWATGIMGAPHTQGGLIYANAPLATVSAWYGNRLKLGSSGIGWRVESGVFSRSDITAGGFQSQNYPAYPGHFYLRSKEAQLLAVYVSRPAFATNTFIYLAQVNTPQSGAHSSGDGFKFLLPPGGSSSEVGWRGGSLGFQRYTLRQSYAEANRFYSDRARSPTNSNPRVRLNAPGTLTRLEPPNASNWPGAPPLGGFPTNEAVFVYVDPTGRGALLRIHPGTNGATDLIIAGGSF